uniref:Reverse transcriptase zinc-binding domain-containing protein n=1 Tax=Cannabis sativa TaxID=3483 RepID=A0A803PD49_CANSA
MFNQALLAKQIWRCIRFPTALCSRVLKASYFSNKSVMEARCGNHASFVWRSLVWGKKLILKWYRWRIGDGDQVRVLQDPWLPRPVTFKIYDQPPLPSQLLVDDLKLGNGQWDEEFFRTVFNKDDAEMILTIPNLGWGTKDKIMWHYTKNGEYTVKSGYQMASELRRERNQSDDHCLVEWWRKLWRLKIPPKIKHFVWKLVYGWLPTNSTLATRHVMCSDICTRCSKETHESIFHALWECKASHTVWKLYGLKLEVKRIGHEDELAFLMRLAKLSNKERFEFFLVVTWSIWNNRKATVHGGVPLKPVELVD